ncbi:hypothetical protein DL98DRAFT_656601 [Cadophora sp. DSE1049]|nr:hypothetical protein DL98DRAFT_656601 [Cadophora sp. DSE1049]
MGFSHPYLHSPTDIQDTTTTRDASASTPTTTTTTTTTFSSLLTSSTAAAILHESSSTSSNVNTSINIYNPFPTKRSLSSGFPDIKQDSSVPQGCSTKDSGQGIESQSLAEQVERIPKKRALSEDTKRQESSGSVQLNPHQPTRTRDYKRQKLFTCGKQSSDQPIKQAGERQLRDGDIGHVLGIGGGGQVLEYDAGPGGLALKLFTDADSFSQELLAYQIIHSSAATEIQSQSPIHTFVPDFHGQVLLPKEFTEHPRSHATSKGSSPFTPYSTALALERLRGPLLFDVLYTIDTCSSSLHLDALQRDMQATLKALHQLGIAHGDITDTNIMFRRSCHKYTDSCFIDFGEAHFQSRLSPSSWQEKCDYDKARVNAIFNGAKASYVVALGLRFMKSDMADTSFSSSLAPDSQANTMELLYKYDHPETDFRFLETLLPYGTHQDKESIQYRLATLLKVASYLPVAAEHLVDIITTQFPNPTPLLTLSLVDTLHRGRRSRQALRILDLQLSEDSLPLLFRARFYEKKILLLRDGGYAFSPSIACLETAIPVFAQVYGVDSVKTMLARYRLSMAYKMKKDMDRAYEIYCESVVLLREMQARCGDCRNVSNACNIRAVEGLLKKWQGELKLPKERMAGIAAYEEKA